MLDFLYIFYYYKFSTILTILFLLISNNTKLTLFTVSLNFDNVIYKTIVFLIVLFLINLKQIFILNLILHITFLLYLTCLIIKNDVKPLKYNKINDIKSFIYFIYTYYYNNSFNIHYNITYIKKSKKFYIYTLLILLLSISILIINFSITLANILYNSFINYRNESNKHLLSIIFYISINIKSTINNNIKIYNKINEDKKIYKYWSKNNGKNKKILIDYIINSKNINNFMKSSILFKNDSYHLNTLRAGRKDSNEIFHYGISTKDIKSIKDYHLISWFTKNIGMLKPYEYPYNDKTKVGIIMAHKEMIINKEDVIFSKKFKQNQNIVDSDDDIIKTLKNINTKQNTLNKNIIENNINNESISSNNFIKKIAKESNFILSKNQIIKIFTQDSEHIVDLKKDIYDTEFETKILADKYRTDEDLIKKIFNDYNYNNESFTNKISLLNNFFADIDMINYDTKLDMIHTLNIKLYKSIVEYKNVDDKLLSKKPQINDNKISQINDTDDIL